MSNQIRSFGDAARAAALREQEEREGTDSLVVDVLGREIEVVFPGTGQAIFMSAALSDAQGDLEQVGGLMQFLYNLVSHEDATYLQKLLLDRYSGFEGDDVIDLLEYLTEQWSNRPTGKPTDSPASQPTRGTSSTAGARRRASTPSTSRTGGSSTSSTRGSARG